MTASPLFTRRGGFLAAARAEPGNLTEAVLLSPLLAVLLIVVCDDCKSDVTLPDAPFFVTLSPVCLRVGDCVCGGTDFRGFAAILHEYLKVRMVLATLLHRAFKWKTADAQQNTGAVPDLVP